MDIRRLAVSALCIAAVASGCAVGFPVEPSNVTTSGVTLNSRVYTSSGGDVTYWFRYGTSTAYGSETPDRTVEMAAGSSRGVSEPIPITVGTEYHWQVCTQDGGEQPRRTNCSKDQSLYVGPVSCAPITRNTWATNDLPDCAPSIGAAGITLNLNAHMFNGYIRNNGFDGVTIENGIAFGVDLVNAADNRLRSMGLTGGAISPSGPDNAISVSGDSAGTVIEDNTATSGPVTLLLASSGVEALRNTLTGAGMTSSNKDGPLVVSGNDNLVARNAVTLNEIGGGRGVGVASIIVSGDDNELLSNNAHNGLLEGILIRSSASGTVLTGNSAGNNGHEFGFGSGIHVESLATSTTLEDNVASNNAELGIDAPDGVTDLGGNRASGNGDPRQCTGVVCQP